MTLFALDSTSDPPTNCINFSTTWLLSSVLKYSSCASSAMSSKWRSIIRRDDYFISTSDATSSCMNFSTTWMLSSVLTYSNSASSAMTFEWRRMLRRDGYLMWRFGEIGEGDDLVCFGKTTMISTSDPTTRCMNSPKTWLLSSVLAYSSCASSAISFEWRMLQQDWYFMRRFGPCLCWKYQIGEAL